MTPSGPPRLCTTDTLRSSPALNESLVVRLFGDDSAQPLRFYLFKDVLDELVFASDYAAENQTCAAVLTGGFGVEGNIGFIEVTGFTGLTSVPELDALYEAVRERTDAHILSGSKDAAVGLFVGQRGCDGHLDPEVARVHFSLFNIPFQPVVICDSDSRKLAVVARGPRRMFFNAAFRGVGTLETAAETATSAGEEE